MKKVILYTKLVFCAAFCLCIFCVNSILFAENIFISQITQGADSGADCVNSHSVEWFNAAVNWANPKQLGKIGPGDTVHLCGTLTTSIVIQGSGSFLNVITILAEAGFKFSKTAWGIDSSASVFISGKNYITIDGNNVGIIEATDNGTLLANQQDSNGIVAELCDTIVVKNWTIKHLYVRTMDSDDPNAFGRSIIGRNCNNLEISNNILSHAYRGIFTYASSANKDNLKIHHNDISAVSIGIVSALAGAVNYTNVEIYNNKIYDQYFWDGCWNSCTEWQHNDGIHLWGKYPSNYMSAAIYNNEIGGDFGSHLTASIFLSEGYVYPALIYNNLLYTTADSPSNGFINVVHRSPSNNTKIYNNTIKGKLAGSGGGNGIYLSGTGAGVVDIKNNIIKDTYVGIWKNNIATITSEYNDIYNVGYVGRNSDGWYTSITAWQGQGYDVHSSTANPQFDSNYKLTALSPTEVSDGGINLSTSFLTDKSGIIRSASEAWSMGAYEYVIPVPPDTTPPKKPSGFKIRSR